GIVGGALSGCLNPCNDPVVPVSTVHVLDPSGAGITGANVTVHDATGGGTPPFMGPSTGAGNAPGTYVATGGFTAHTGLTLHVDAPGFQSLDRPLASGEVTSPTGCGFAATVTVTLTPTSP